MRDNNPISEKARAVQWRMSNEKVRFSEELRVIPAWAYVLAIVAVVAMEIFLPIVRKHDAHPMPLPLLALLMVFAGFVVAVVPLLIGYVNCDAKRRGMNRTLWTILVILIPNAIGYIIYFLVREPLVFVCPQCGESVSARFNFCPKCKYNLRPACPECKHETSSTDRFCPYCSHDLTGDRQAGATPITPASPAPAS